MGTVEMREYYTELLRTFGSFRIHTQHGIGGCFVFLGVAIALPRGVWVRESVLFIWLLGPGVVSGKCIKSCTVGSENKDIVLRIFGLGPSEASW